MTTVDKPSLRSAIAGLVAFEFYLVVLITVTALVIELTASALGRNPLDSSIFSYMVPLAALVIGFDLTLFLSKRKSPVIYIALGPIVIAYAVFSQVLSLHRWFLLINSEINKIVHILTSLPHLRFA